MDQIHLHAYFGVLILAALSISNGESTESLCDGETGRESFRATMSLENFCIISRIIRFDNRDIRTAWRQRDKLAAIRSLWDKWMDRLPLFYVLGPNVTVEEQFMHLDPLHMESRSGLPVMLHHMCGTCKCIWGSQMEEPLRRKKGCRLSWM
jgi:hypothetical protein